MVQIDISMPASCDDCPFLLVDYETNVPDCDLMEDLPNCPEYDVYTPIGQRDKNCPLREVPKRMDCGWTGIEDDYPVSIREVIDITAETDALTTQRRVRELKPYRLPEREDT